MLPIGTDGIVFPVAGGSGGGVTSWNDLKDKPFHTEQGVVIESVERKAFAFSLDSQYGSLGIYSCNPVFSGELANHFVLVENETYKVEWDGKTYECNGLAFNVEGISGIGIGNASLLYTGDDTGEPFVILYIPKYGNYSNHVSFMTNDTSSSHVIRIYQETEIVHQLDPKYVDGYTRYEIDNKGYLDEAKARVLIDEVIVEALNSEV